MLINKIVYEKGDYMSLPPLPRPPPSSVMLVFSQRQATQLVDKAEQSDISKSNSKERLRAKKEAATRKRRGGTLGGNVEPAQNVTVSFFKAIA